MYILYWIYNVLILILIEGFIFILIAYVIKDNLMR
jgi:hypothetical protein